MSAGSSNGWALSVKWLRNLIGGAALAALFVIGSVVPGARPAHACSCDYDGTSIASLLNSSNTTAFIGRATSVSEPNPQGTVTYTFTVDRSLKGNGGPTIAVQTASSAPMCGVTFPLNVSLGVALAGRGKDGFAVGLCGGHISTRNVSAFETFASGTLPAPTGSGAVAGFSGIGDGIGAVFDDQLRVLGYIPGLPNSYFDACPGDRYLYGFYTAKVDEIGNPVLGAFRVDLATLAVTRYSNAGLDDVSCLDSDGTLILSGGPSVEEPSHAFVTTVTRAGTRRNVPVVPGYTYFHGPVGDSSSLAWSTETEVVVTNMDGTVLRRLPYNRATSSGSTADIRGGYLFDESANRATFTVTALATGATVAVDSPLDKWRVTDGRLYRLLNPTTIEVVELPSGARSQIAVTNGPNDANWRLETSFPNGSLLLTYDDGIGGRAAATNFYVVSPTGAATRYPTVAETYLPDDWVGGNFATTSEDGEAWLLSTQGPQRVLNGYFLEPWIQRLTSGITLSPNACGTTSIPTTNYRCSLSPPLQRLPDTL